MPLSKEFIAAVKLSHERMYCIARIASVDATFLSKAINGIIRLKEGDARLARVAKVVGVSEDCIFAGGKER